MRFDPTRDDQTFDLTDGCERARLEDAESRAAFELDRAAYLERVAQTALLQRSTSFRRGYRAATDDFENADTYTDGIPLPVED